jgi:hypothetical protein
VPPSCHPGHPQLVTPPPRGRRAATPTVENGFASQMANLPVLTRANVRRASRTQAPGTSNPVCPYCSRESQFFTTSEAIYNGRNYGPLYVCLPCQAWVGCHPGTTTPLGRLANAELRRAKMQAHEAFDSVWRALYERRRASDPSYPRGRARGSRYKRLAALLGIPPRQCHIGMFDVDQCLRVVEIFRSGALASD